MMGADESKKEGMKGIIQAVKTPLGFFVLVVLIVEAILGGSAIFSSGPDRTYLVIGMISLLFLLVIIVAVMAYFRPSSLYGKGTTISQREQLKPSEELSSQEKHYLNILKSSEDSKQLEDAIKYFKGNPIVQALEPLSAMVYRNESEFFFLREDAIAAIGNIQDGAALKLLLERAVSEETPGVRADYVSALIGFDDPSIVVPLIQILESAGGDVVGYPALTLARKLKDPRLASAVKYHFDSVLPVPVGTRYLELCRDLILDLETIKLHEEIGLTIDLPRSMDLILSRNHIENILAERDPKRLAIYLKYLKDTRSLPEEDLVRASKEGMRNSDTLVRWLAVELASILEADLIGVELRKAFENERIPFMDGIIAEVLSRGWRPTDCSLIASKLKGYSIVSEYKLGPCMESGEILIRQLVSRDCKESVPALKLFAKAIGASEYHKDGVKSVRRAIQALMGS